MRRCAIEAVSAVGISEPVIDGYRAIGCAMVEVRARIQRIAVQFLMSDEAEVQINLGMKSGRYGYQEAKGGKCLHSSKVGVEVVRCSIRCSSLLFMAPSDNGGPA